MSISAVVITLNEEANIERCLQSLRFTDEIVVLDSMSTDDTVELARKYTDKVGVREFSGYGEQKAAALEMATCDWVLIVDADEVISESLADEIICAVKNGRLDGYKIPRSTYFLGKWIRYCGWYPDYQLRLAKRERAQMPPRLIHEHLVVNGDTGILNSPIIHYSYTSMGDYARKMISYAQAAAEQKLREGRKTRLSDILFTPGLTFVKIYILKQGFRDGLHGFILSCLSASAIFLRYATLWDMSRREDAAKERNKKC